MRYHGKSGAGKVRFRCIRCNLTTSRKRSDTKSRHAINRLEHWLLSKETLTSLGTRLSLTRQTLSKQFQEYFNKSWHTTITLPHGVRVLILDATWIHKRELLVLVALLDQVVVAWSFAPKETSETWHGLLRHLPSPEVVVSDGHTGLLKTVYTLWPFTRIQRCHFHIVKRMREHIPRKPETEAAREVRALILSLKTVKTHEEAITWYQAYEIWNEKYYAFLNEHSFSLTNGRKHWWYTHKKIRAVRSHLRGTLSHLFTYLDYAGVPNTTNHVEGGINTKIKEAIRLHRGLRIHQKKTLVSILLTEENRRKKATRKFT